MSATQVNGASSFSVGDTFSSFEEVEGKIKEYEKIKLIMFSFGSVRREP